MFVDIQGLPQLQEFGVCLGCWSGLVLTGGCGQMRVESEPWSLLHKCESGFLHGLGWSRAGTDGSGWEDLNSACSQPGTWAPRLSRSFAPSRTHPGRRPPTPRPGHVLCTCSHIHHPSRLSGCIPVLSAPSFTCFRTQNGSIPFALVTPSSLWPPFLSQNVC